MDTFNIYYGRPALASPSPIGYYVEGGDCHGLRLLQYDCNDEHPDYKSIAKTVAANFPGTIVELTLLSQQPESKRTNHRFGIVKGKMFGALDDNQLKELATEIAHELRGR
ncbi:hypothetical protein KY328_03365 [Candidatus Woesearchaeota archaeon]|nr:hypothetical protein [Candidatus Woesearchaeota archaeon]MBW3021933.1 hypothetical protein [Candidatus Woesearchaeota archaeon]